MAAPYPGPGQRCGAGGQDAAAVRACVSAAWTPLIVTISGVVRPILGGLILVLISSNAPVRWKCSGNEVKQSNSYGFTKRYKQSFVHWT